VFGPKPERALELAEGGASKAEILEQTGCTIAVRDVGFEVHQGETFVVMGLSGSGKSTLVRCVARLIDASRGSITIDGEELTTMSEEQLRHVRREKLSMVFQHFGLLPHRRVIDNVAYGLEVQHMSKTDRHARALEVLDVVGLQGWGSHYPQQLSGGMQQRVGLARALAVDPEILFFDEPFSALDPLIRREMQDELIRLQNEMHCTIVFITHDFAEAIKLGDRIAIMKDGALDQIGTAAELITNPATDYVREFTTDIPKAKVLTARDVMHAADGESPRSTVQVTATVESLLPDLLTDSRPLEVVDESGMSLGVVDRDAVAKVLDQ
jgi:glycine betaine/proline transport system ATP-binding protein